MLQIQQNLLLLAVVADKGMKRITVRDPADQTRVGRQRYHRVSLNSILKRNTLIAATYFKISNQLIKISSGL